jgi:hypothetical protein
MISPASIRLRLLPVEVSPANQFHPNEDCSLICFALYAVSDTARSGVARLADRHFGNAGLTAAADRIERVDGVWLELRLKLLAGLAPVLLLGVLPAAVEFPKFIGTLTNFLLTDHGGSPGLNVGRQPLHTGTGSQRPRFAHSLIAYRTKLFIAPRCGVRPVGLKQ